jgi:hypothetical protein
MQDSIYRSNTLGQSYNLFVSDQSVSAAGSQTMTFDLSSAELRSRIDRSYVYDGYWLWAFPDLKPLMNYSLIVHDGLDGFACFIAGQNSFFAADPSIPLGYADSYLSDYLVHTSRQFALPWLFKKFMSETSQLQLSETRDPISRKIYKSVSNPTLDLAMLIDPATSLPYAIRSLENHVVFGNSTSDLVLSSWAEAKIGNGTMLFPHRFQTVYNSVIVLEDFVIAAIGTNEEIPADYFKPDIAPYPKDEVYPEGNQQPPTTTPSKPAQNPDYPRSEVHEAFEAGLWGGPFGEVYNISNVSISHPIQGLDEISTIYIGYPDYVQVLIEFEDGLLITDAPAHRSKIILDWVDIHKNGKKITHVVPSHHHRDHAGGVDDFVDAGATLVVPEIAAGFYNFTGKILQMVTYREDKPFILKDSKVQFRSFWKDGNPHARDWAFSVAGPSNPTSPEQFVVFNADVVNPGTDARRWDTGSALRFFNNAVEIGLPPETTLVGAHGSSDGGKSTSEQLARLASTAGFPYPQLTVKDWTAKNW